MPVLSVFNLTDRPFATEVLTQNHRRIMFRLLSVALTAILLAGCGPVTKRFEVAVTLRVDGNESTGVAVWQAVVSDGSTLFFPTGPDVNVSAEAVEIPTRLGGSYFALLREASPPQDFRGSPTPTYGTYILDCLRDLISTDDPAFLSTLENFQGSCRTDETPVIVKFGNLNTPDTIEVVPYGEEHDVDLVSVVVTATEAPITRNIFSSLKWLSGLEYGINVRSGRPDHRFSYGFLLKPDEIYVVDFVKGSMK